MMGTHSERPLKKRGLSSCKPPRQLRDHRRDLQLPQFSTTDILAGKIWELQMTHLESTQVKEECISKSRAPSFSNNDPAFNNCALLQLTFKFLKFKLFPPPPVHKSSSFLLQSGLQWTIMSFKQLKSLSSKIQWWTTLKICHNHHLSPTHISGFKNLIY